MRLPRPRGLRSRLQLVVVLGAAVFVALLTAGFNLAFDSRLNGDANDLLRQRVAAHLQTLATSGGRLAVAEAPDAAVPDAPIWIYAGGRALERPAAAAADQRAADALAGGPRRFRRVGSTNSRLYAIPVVAHGRRLGTVVAAVELAAYQRAASTALIASLIFAAIVLVAIALVARWTIGAALRPVARMTAEAADRSEHDLDRRFALGPPRDELTQLAATFDDLLARVAAGLRREQRFTAEVSHELRTPLAALIAETDLALRKPREGPAYRDALVAVRRSAERMQRTLEALFAAARSQADGSTGSSDARAGIRDAVEALAPNATQRGIRIELRGESPVLRVAADADVVARIVAPLLENGCRHARSLIAVSSEAVNGDVRITVADDGPGVPAAERERVFEPGVRLGCGGGAGLGLSLARRLARAVHGDVVCDGAVFRVRLPPA